MKTTFFLIRHGEAEQNVKGITSSLPENLERHLTARGREQIETRARELKDASEPIVVIFHSPLARARETAEMLAHALGAPLREDGRLRETDFDVFNGRDIAEFHARYPRKVTRLQTDGSDGVEGFVDERERVEAFAHDALSEYGGKKIVVVSHADTIQTLSGVLKKLSLEETFLKEKSFCPSTGEMVRVEVEGEI